MSRRVVFMYAGQGAQYYQMGRELWEQEPAYRHALERYCRIAGPVGGRTLTEVLFSRPISDSPGFDRLAETHPLLVAISLALTDMLAEKGIRPDAVLGYSLGETIAAVVCGALEAEEAFWAVRAQAALFERRVGPGRLVAVLAAPEQLEAALPRALDGRVHVAALNAPGHFVVAAAEADLPALMDVLRGLGVPTAPLPVRFAFHSPLIAEAEQGLRDIAGQLSLRPIAIPMVSCATAAPLAAFDAAHFWRVARGVVRFADAARPLIEDPEARLLDVGPSGTLAGFVRLSGPTRVAPMAVMNQFGRDVNQVRQVVEWLA